jgi:hypothetical protein
MTKLTDLSEQELADLLDLPLDKARKWLEVAKSISHAAKIYKSELYKVQPSLSKWLELETESATSLQRSSVKELMGLSVEEVKQLKRTGEFYRRFPYFKRKAPTDADSRLRYLRDLLRYETEFQARYPVAYELLFGRSEKIGGLPLPSFGIRILHHDPQDHVLPAGWFQEWKRSQNSGDAFSLMSVERTKGDKKVDQSLAPLDLGYMRGVLLAILSREEYEERIATDLHDEAIREQLGAPAQSSVRITDLRLALAPDLKNIETLKKALRPLFGSIEKPITPEGVLQWKWDLLREDEKTKGEESEDTKAKITRVSFAAAALLLFLDFDMPGIEGASTFVLTEQSGKLVKLIQKVSNSLNTNAENLENLLAFRAPHRPPTPDQIFYDALIAYRLGTEERKIFDDVLGKKSYKSSPSEPGGSDHGGTKHWKTKLADALERGIDVEKEKYPLANAVFANRYKPRIKAKARLAYHAWGEEIFHQPHSEEPWLWPNTGNRINVNASTDSGLEVVQAYVQLGSCLERNLNPFPTRSDLLT